MQIDKAQILQLLQSQGDDAKAQQADQELPGQVDTEQHAGLLQSLGLDPMDLVRMLGGGGLGGLGGGGNDQGGGGGLGGAIGGILGR
ncbi:MULTISPECIES: hypothetical protein [unclassified Geodermatophilus]